MSGVTLRVELVLFTIRDALLVHLRPSDVGHQLPGRAVAAGESLEDVAGELMHTATGRDDVYGEQLYTFGDPDRDPRGHVVSATYFAVMPAPERANAPSFFSARRPPQLAYDHAAILARALERLRTKSEYTTVPLRLLAEPFTLSDVQAVYEAILGRTLDKRNFRRKMLALDALVETQEQRRDGAHRPARLFRLSPERPYLLKERGILFPF